MDDPLATIDLDRKVEVGAAVPISVGEGSWVPI